LCGLKIGEKKEERKRFLLNFMKLGKNPQAQQIFENSD
jgi:hypothetical protein